MPSTSARWSPVRRTAELKLPRVPPLHRARVVFWLALGVAALRTLWPAPPAPELAAVDAGPGDCVLARRGTAPACRCEDWPGSLRVVLGVALPLNRASQTDLRAVPGIGPVRARAITDERERRGRFASLHELVRVRGIGPAMRARLAPYLFVEGGDPACGREPVIPPVDRGAEAPEETAIDRDSQRSD